MKQKKARCFWALLLILAIRSGAQEYNTVPLDHGAYDIIAIGVMRGIILSPPGAKPWSVHTVKGKLREMANDSLQALAAEEVETVTRILDSLERKTGLELKEGMYRTVGEGFTFEAGLGWESAFSVETPDASVASVNIAKIYAGGDMQDFASWNVTALGELLYIERQKLGLPEREGYAIQSAFPFIYSKQWDGGVLSLRRPGEYAGWPDDPALAGGLEAELNAVFLNQLLQLRLGRVRRDWGSEANGASLFLNAHARPFTAIEATVMPLSWLNISFLSGALEHFREDSRWSDEGPFSNMLMAAQLEFNPLRYIHFGIGGAAVLINQPNAALFSDLTLRLPGLFTLWGSLFLDRLYASSENFFFKNGNSYAYQAGIRTIVYWLPLATFTLRYTKVEPYCYTGTSGGSSGNGWTSPVSAFISGGESLGYYLPPNSDELLLRFESKLFPAIDAHIQFQMIRHGVDYGYSAVPGSSLYDVLADDGSNKYFLMDGVYQWDNVIKIGGSLNLKAGGTPLAVYAETGVVMTNFTINGDVGVGNEADYQPLDDSTYSGRTGFIFSIGFRVFR